MQSVGVKNFPFDHDPRHANTVENVRGKPYALPFAQDYVNLAAVVGNEYKRTAGGSAQLGAEGMIVTVRVIAKVATCVAELASHGHGPSAHSLSSVQLNVPSLCHALRSCQVEDQALCLRERHIIQPIPISELESTQSQSGECGDQPNHGLSR